MTPKEQACGVVRILRKQYPDATCTLAHQDPWQLLVASILSAQCTDARVNQITPALFARYPGLSELASADRAELEEIIRSCGLYRTKAKALVESSRILMEQYDGAVPQDRKALMTLPGVGRKIANVILGDAFGIPAIVVDTHCARISRLIGLTDQKDPLLIERDLAAVLDPSDWIDYGHLMVAHGRSICMARRPQCSSCPLSKSGLCQFATQKTKTGVEQRKHD